jgi:hypothetical protein
MAITYNWVFPTLTAYPTHAGQTDVVFTVHWRLNGTDEENHIGEVYGSVGVTYNEGDPFVPFNELTKEIVQGWVETAMGTETVDAYKQNITNQIQEQITPSQINLTPPWV